MKKDQPVSPGAYAGTFVALLALLGLSIVFGFVHLSRFNFGIGMAIACAKAMLIFIYFMHLKVSSPVVRLAAAVGILMFLILLGLTISDYATRDVTRG